MKPQDNAADPKQVSEAKHRERRKSEREVEDLSKVLSMIEGRRTLWRLMEHCGVFETTFSADLGTMGYNSGKQDIGHFIMQQIVQADADAFGRMMSERRKGEY